jgi:hypothetical protein
MKTHTFSTPHAPRGRATRPLALSLVFMLIAVAPLALGQQKPKKKGRKPAPSASASAAPEAAPEPTPEPAPPPPPASSAEAPSETPAESKELPAIPPEKKWDSSDTREEKDKTYYFLGLRYRGTVIPKFFVNLFVNEGATFYSNSVGAELDIRRENHSTVPWIAWTGYGFGDTLFFEKNKPDDPANYSDVNSALWGLFLGLDELWSAPLDTKHHFDFEYGFGVGIGFIFGSLTNDWVYQTANGPLTGSNGSHYAPCGSQAQPGDTTASCTTGRHNNAQVAKVGNYQEPNWFNGGAVPVVFPQITLPNLGLRIKPVKQFEMRVSFGFSITGLWFGISGNYGLEKPPEESEPPHKKDSAPRESRAGRGSRATAVPGWL